MSQHTLELLERVDARIICCPPSSEAMSAMMFEGPSSTFDAVSRLGYNPTPRTRPSQTVRTNARPRRNQPKVTFRLAEALEAEGIKPFTLQSVSAYKKAMLRGDFQIFDHEMPVFFCLIAVIGGALTNASAFFFVGTLISWAVGLGNSPLGEGALGPVFALVPIIFTLIKVFSINRMLPSGSSVSEKIADYTIMAIAFGSLGWICLLFAWPEKEWRTVPLEQYKKEIPVPVLDTVAKIHRQCPGATFHVEELVNNTDPFIVARLRQYGLEEEYYVEVWLEPKFEGNRAA